MKEGEYVKLRNLVLMSGCQVLSSSNFLTFLVKGAVGMREGGVWSVDKGTEYPFVDNKKLRIHRKVSKNFLRKYLHIKNRREKCVFTFTSTKTWNETKNALWTLGHTWVIDVVSTPSRPVSTLGVG